MLKGVNEFPHESGNHHDRTLFGLNAINFNFKPLKNSSKV